jgi:hypothetical protein
MPLKHNTVEKILPITGGTLRRTVLTVTVVIVGLNIFGLFFLMGHNVDSSLWLLRTKWERLLSGPPVDWLILGDSSGNQGVDAGLFAEAMGPAYNFCTFSNALLLNDEQMLEEYVKRNAAPKGVVLAHTYHVWHFPISPQVVAHVPVGFAALSEYLRFAPSKSDFLLEFFSCRWFPLYSQPYGYRELFTDPGMAFAPRFPIDGWGFVPVDKPDTAYALQHWKHRAEDRRKRAYVITLENRVAATRICELAQTHGFDVYYAFTPLYEAALSDSLVLADCREELRILRGLETRYSRFHVLGGLPPAEKLERMQYLDHVTLPAARDFTRSLVHQLKMRREGSAAAAL